MGRKKKRKATSIERKVASYLKERGIYFIREKRIETYPVDFYLPGHKKVIQTDGCWYHGCKQCYTEDEILPRYKIQAYRDKANVALLEHNGLKVLRLPEHEIMKEWEECKQKIEIFLKA